jgi:hypothetical protein
MIFYKKVLMIVIYENLFIIVKNNTKKNIDSYDDNLYDIMDEI